MGIFEKTKQVTSKMLDKAINFSSDELLADTIMTAVKKQEKVNEILRQRGSNYRVSDIDLQIGVPPTVVFGIRRLHEQAHATSQSTAVSVSAEHVPDPDA